MITLQFNEKNENLKLNKRISLIETSLILLLLFSRC